MKIRTQIHDADLRDIWMRQDEAIFIIGASVPFFDPAASASAAVAASPPSQVDAWGVVLRRGKTVVRSRGTALCSLCGRDTAEVLVSRFLPAGADGVEELDIISGCPPLFSESRPVATALSAAVG